MVFIVAFAAGATWFVLTHRKHNASAPSEVPSLISDVSRHYVLPTDEEPAIATVTDKTKLTTPLFTKSENGDKALIYQKNALVIIYRPSIDRIIAVGPVSIDNVPTESNKSK